MTDSLERATRAFWDEYHRHNPRDADEHEDAVRAGLEAVLATTEPPKHGDHERLAW